MKLFARIIYIICIFLGTSIFARGAQADPEGDGLTAPDSLSNRESGAVQPKAQADWFAPEDASKWYQQVQRHTNHHYLAEYFEYIGYEVPKDTYALIAPIRNHHGKIKLEYFSYKDTAFVYSMTQDGEENFWPASTVKLTAAVLALLKLREYQVKRSAILNFTDIEGHFEGTVETLCREAIIPSNNTAYNRLMEIAGFDEINDYYIPKILQFPRMILQRRYVREHPEDDLRHSPEIQYTDGEQSGVIPARDSSGKMRERCPRESNCSTLAELGEMVFRVVLHEELSPKRRIPLDDSDISMLREMLLKAPSCISEGVATVMGNKALVYNKGGKVFADDRLEIAIVSSPDKKERYIIALSMPYYDGVEKETNLLAQHLIEAMRSR